MKLNDCRVTEIPMYKLQSGDVFKWDDNVFIMGHCGKDDNIIRYMTNLKTCYVSRLDSTYELVRVEPLNVELNIL